MVFATMMSGRQGSHLSLLLFLLCLTVASGHNATAKEARFLNLFSVIRYCLLKLYSISLIGKLEVVEFSFTDSPTLGALPTLG